MIRYDSCMDKKHHGKRDRSSITLTQFIPYQIKIAGRPSENWSEWINEMEIQIETDLSGLATTTLTATLDQAALIGLIRKLYYLGFPLISVYCIDLYRNDNK